MRTRLLLLSLPLATLLSCTDDPAPAPNDTVDPCPPLELGRAFVVGNLFGQITGVSYAVTPGLGEAMPERLLVELYDSTTEGITSALAAGTFPLGSAPNEDLATCQHCVWLPIDWDGESPLDRVMWATEGSITLTQVTDPLEITFAGSIAGLRLREATVDDAGHATLVEGGACRRIDAVVFDTNPTPGRSCLSAEDCGNPMLEICDPSTQKCGDIQCGDFLSCEDPNDVCLAQYGERMEGACYTTCEPMTGGCAGGQRCVQLGIDPTFGVCMAAGTTELGSTCERADTSAVCEEGAVCSTTTSTCTRVCDFYSSGPGCDAGTLCSLFGVCEPLSYGVDVPFGAPCGEQATLAQGCAPNGQAFEGYCFAFDPGAPLICEEACLGDHGCEAGEFCAMRFTSGLGICLPLPVCGDGVVGEINEVCDDGNENGNDGCSSDCSTVEYGPICGGAASLSVGTSVHGDTADAWDGFLATCQLGLARSQVWTYTAPGPGRLRLWVESDTMQLVSVRSDCDDPESELQCATNDPWAVAPEVVLQLTEASPEALTILVSAFTVLEQGPFTLHSEFVGQVCGDGVVAGSEVCDDSNTDSDDGCSGDCSTIEYDFYCGAATQLTPGVPHSGTLTSGPHLYSSSCSNDFYGSGPDRLHQITAPATGQLRLELQQPGFSEGNGDLALAVYQSCGDPAAAVELGCSSVRDPEELFVEVTQGDVLTVLVEGFGPDDGGAYVLTVEMVAP